MTYDDVATWEAALCEAMPEADVFVARDAATDTLRAEWVLTRLGPRQGDGFATLERERYATVIDGPPPAAGVLRAWFFPPGVYLTREQLDTIRATPCRLVGP